MNINAEEGSEEDSYRFNPWRAPGYAPIVDPCGQAGGKLTSQNIGGDSIFTDNKYAKMGDLGSNLPETPADKKTKWAAGSTVKVRWGPLYNHGGRAWGLGPGFGSRVSVRLTLMLTLQVWV